MSLIIASYVIVFSLGYIIARLNDIGKKLNNKNERETIHIQPQILQNQQEFVIKKDLPATQNKPIQIDERLFITQMKTDTLEKRYDSSKLGETTTETDTNFSSSVSKLASLKKKNES